MNNWEIRQVTEEDSQVLEIITDWMYAWWGKAQGFTRDAMRCAMAHSAKKQVLPQTYGLFDDGRIIGMFQFIYYDLEVRPDIYPWLANVYVDKKYRGMGAGGALLGKVGEIARKTLPFDELYLYTDHTGLYEKFGWTYVSELDTYIKSPRIQRLYKMDIRDDG